MNGVNGNTGNRHWKNLSAFTCAAFRGVNGMSWEAKNTMETDKHTKNEEKNPRGVCSTLCLTLEVLVRKSSIMFDVCCLSDVTVRRNFLAAVQPLAGIQ